MTRKSSSTRPSRAFRHQRWSWTASWPVFILGALTIEPGLVAEEAQAPAPAPAADQPKPPSGDANGEDLAVFADMPVVVSGSRQKTRLNLSPAAVSVVTADDLHYGGETTLGGALQFVPGVDSLRVDRNTYAIGVHGLHGIFSDRTLTLVNGRNADSPAFGGSEFFRLPLFLADIERIEVVRGPGGAAWGANAYNGVINIITKDPDDVDMQGIFGSSTVTAFGDTLSEARWCSTMGALSWRTSIGYENHVSSSHALQDNTFANDDWRKGALTDNEVLYRLDPTTRLRFGLGYSQFRSGTLEFAGYQPTAETSYNTTRAFTKVEHQFSEETSGSLQWFGNFNDTNQPSTDHYRTNENSLDGQIDFAKFHGHRFSLGGQAELLDIKYINTGDPNQFGAVNSPYHEQRVGAFLIDHWQVTQALALDGQFREDHYTGTGNDWAGRVSALYSFDHDDRQVLRLSTAKAYRTPMSGTRDGIGTHPIFGNPFLIVNVLPGDHLKNEETWTLETGYTNEITKSLLLRWDSYYQRYEHLIGYNTTVSPPFPIVFTSQPMDLGGATGYGSELELAWTDNDDPIRSRFSVWYALNNLETDHINQSVRAFAPARHKVGATSRVFLPNNFVFDANYRYSSTTVDPANATGNHVDISHHLDVDIAWRFDHNRGEIMFGVTDVLNPYDQGSQGTASLSSHITPGRIFFLRGELSF